MASFTFGRTIWTPYLIGGRWCILQSALNWTQMGDPAVDSSCVEVYGDTRPLKRWRDLQLERPPLATPLIETDEFLRPTKRSRISQNECSSRTPPRGLIPTQSTVVSTIPNIWTMIGKNGLLDDWTRYDTHHTSEYNISEYNPSAYDPGEYIKFLKAYDWSKTAMGPMSEWSNSVRQHMYPIMAHPEPRCIYFGHEDPVMLYNESCSKLLGNLHPAAMGVSGSVGAGHWWQYKLDCLSRVMKSGNAEKQSDCLHPLPRGDLPLVESYFSWWILPLVDENGNVYGATKEIYEVTSEMIEKRRAATFRKAKEINTLGETMATYWAKVQEVIHSNPEDFTFSLAYSIRQDQQFVEQGFGSVENVLPNQLKLEGMIGLAEDHELATQELDVTDYGSPLTKHFHTAWATQMPVFLKNSDNSLPSSLKIAIKGRGFDSICHTAVLYPIRKMGSYGSSVGFLLLGLNPRRPYDAPYRSFLEATFSKFEEAAAMILVPEEREQLIRARQRAKEEKLLFTKLATFAPVGLAIYEPSGRLHYRNDLYRDLNNLQESSTPPFDSIIPEHPEDHIKVQKIWSRLVSSLKPDDIHFQYRVQKDLSIPQDITVSGQWRWIQAHVSTRSDDFGKVKSVIIFVHDVTAEFENFGEQGRRLKDAMEAKRQSEDFIDMVS